MLLYVPPPDEAGRLAALQVHTQGLPLDDSVNLADIAAATERFTGAELQYVCEEAAVHSAQRLCGAAGDMCAADFRSALRGMQPALSPGALRQFEEWGADFSR